MPTMTMATSKDVTWSSTEQAAEHFGCNAETLRRWRKRGWLQEGVHWKRDRRLGGNATHLLWCIAALEEVNERPDS